MLSRLQDRMKEEGCTQLLVASPKQIEYLIHRKFSCGERMLALVVYQNSARLFINELFPIAPIENVETVFFNDCDDAVSLLNASLTDEPLGVDGEFASRFLLKLLKMSQREVSDQSDLIDDLRAIKSCDEQAKMRKASQLNDQVMHEVRKLLKVGVSEKEVADKIHELFMEISHGNESFETIVAFGQNGADPHCVPGERRLKANESIIIDMGCRFEGYCSDMTRTFFVGENSMKEIYDLVLEANLAAKKVIRPGVKFSEIDRAAREVIEKAGYGKAFFHRLGHGIGLDVHEPYDVSGSNDRVVREGMCFSIEPGIYLPETGGVRLEDLVLVTSDGCEVLNAYPFDQEIIEL